MEFLRALLPTVEGDVSYYVGINRPPSADEDEGEWEQLACSNVAEVAAVLDKERDHAETYVALAAFAPGEGRKKAAVVAKSWISADVDAKVMPGGTPEERRANARTLLGAVPVPIVLVDSGGGFHPHVRLPEGDRLEALANRADGCAHVERLAIALRRFLEAKAHELFGVTIELDHTHTADRVWRVPGGFNCKAKDGEKALTAERCRWRPVLLVGRAEGIAATAEADLGFLVPFMGTAPAHAGATATDTGASGSTGFDPTLLPARLRACWPMTDGNQSENDFAVCAALSEAGHGPDLMAAAIEARRDALLDPEDRAKGRRSDYVYRTVAAAQHRASCVTRTPHTPQGACDTSDKFRLISAVEFVARVQAKIEWFWEGVIPRGATVVVSGLPKAGKTTLLFHLVRALVRVTRGQGGSGGVCDAEEFLGRATARCRVAWLRMEEPPALFRDRIVALGLGDAIELFLLDPDANLPSLDALAQLEAAVAAGRIEVLFVDPMIDFFQVEDENDAPEMARAFRKLRDVIRRTGCTIVLIHHDGKGEGEGLKLVRGSTAITGSADVAVQVTAPYGELDPRRRIQVKGRYGFQQFDAALGPAGYELLDPEEYARQRAEERDTKERARQARTLQLRTDTVARAVDYLKAHPEGVTRQVAIDALKLSVNQASGILDSAVKTIGGRVEEGKGRKPRTWFPASPVREAPNDAAPLSQASGTFESPLPWLGYSSDIAPLWEEHWERWQERAAVLEHHGGLPREEAERRAWQELAP